MSKQDRQGVRTAQDLERKYKFGEYEKLIKELRSAIAKAEKTIAEMKAYTKSNMNSDKESEIFTTTVSIFLEPGDEELQVTGNHVNGSETIPDDKISLYDFDNNGIVDINDHILCGFAGDGLISLANWSGAEKSEVTVTIDMSSPENIVSAKGTNMWGREVEFTASDLIADMLLDIDYLKSKSSEVSSETISKTISIFLEPGEEEATTIANHVAEIDLIPDDEIYLYDFNNNGTVTDVERRMVNQVLSGSRSLASWSGAVKSDVVVTIDMSTPEKIVSAKGTNMWGREVELTSIELFEYILKDIEYNKYKIEALRDEIASIESGSYDDSDIKSKIEELEAELEELGNNSYDDTELKNDIEALFDNDVILEGRIDAVSKYKHVIESGTSGAWNYEKFSDSSIVCRKRFTPTISTFYDTGILDTYYRETTFKFPDGLLNAEPTHILITPISESEYYPSVSVTSASAEAIVVKTIMQTIDSSKSFKIGWYVEVVGTTDGLG